MPILALAFIVALGAELGQWLFPAGSTGTLSVWVPTGLLLGGLVLSERQRWPLQATLGGLIVVASMLMHGTPPLLAGGAAVMTVLQAVGGSWVLQRFRTPFTLNRVVDAFAFVGVAVAASVIGALVPAVLAGGPVRGLWQAWTVAIGLGILLAAPLVIGWRAEWTARRELFNSGRLAELALAAAGAAVTAHVVFGEIAPEFIQVPAVTLPFFIWGAFRFGPAGSSVTVLTICLIGMAHTMTGVGPLAMEGASRDLLILRAQGTCVMAAVSFLLLASVVAERREAMFERARLVEELQQALAEIKTLQGLIPICAWCHKVRDDADVWQGLETYLDAHTDATFSHSICPSCTEKQSVAAEHWRI